LRSLITTGKGHPEEKEREAACYLMAHGLRPKPVGRCTREALVWLLLFFEPDDQSAKPVNRCIINEQRNALRQTHNIDSQQFVFRPAFCRVTRITPLMVNSNLKILLRGLWRKKSFTLLNILGLSVGISASLLIFLLVRYELSIDSFHAKRDRIYRVLSTETFRNGVVEDDGCSPIPLADGLRQDFPQPEKIARVWNVGQAQFGIPSTNGGRDKQVLAHDVYFADPDLFDIFDFHWVQGNAETALQEPYTMAISKSLAENWYGRWQEAVGKTIVWGDDQKPYKITGILENPPSNTDISLQVVLSYATFRQRHAREFTDPMNWDNFSTGSQCFFVLRKGQHIESMNAQLPHFVAVHFTPLFEHSDTRDSCFFQPLKEMHFNSNFDRYGKRGWTYAELWSMGLIGIFLLAVACINFINLSTAQSLNRAKEVGVRKVLGSSRGQLLRGFLWETAALVFLALIFGCVMAQMALPQLKQLLERPVSLDLLNSRASLLYLLGTGVLVTILAGSYPGMVLARFDPVAAFKSKINTKTVGGISLRRGLIVLQFAIAQLLIIGTLVIVRQMDFFRNRPMGFDRKAISLVNLPDSKDRVRMNAWFQSQVAHLPGVISTSLCSDPPSTVDVNAGLFVFENDSHPENFEPVRRYADTGYFSVFHLGLAAGRYIYPSDTEREAVFNETAVKLLGIRSPEAIIGKTIHFGDPKNRLTIVGVVRDFQSTSLREKIKPLIFQSRPREFWRLAVRLEPEKIQATMARLQTLFTQTYPDQFFVAPFFDDTVVDFYNAEAIESKLFKTFALLAIFISCLGLYGLVSFMAVQKTKEVGIRKVLGASVTGIIYLFSREFLVLIGLSFLIAAPIGYFLMHSWLSGYYYHMDIGWGVFAIAIILSVVIAMITVGAKAVKAALANPVKSLRTE
jgi:putative ABC transport system permease protein